VGVGLKRIVQRLVLAAVLAAFAAACNTMAGLGRDLEKLGAKIEKKAEEKRRY
jgi:predicted small secreted protein